MKLYKRLLLKKLGESGWDLISQDSDTDWWLEEVWTIKSIHNNWGLELLILFLVDLQYDETDKSSAVWAVSAVREMPSGYTETEDGLSVMSIKGDFDQQANEFLSVINEYRDTTS